MVVDVASHEKEREDALQEVFESGRMSAPPKNRQDLGPFGHAWVCDQHRRRRQFFYALWRLCLLN